MEGGDPPAVHHHLGRGGYETAPSVVEVYSLHWKAFLYMYGHFHIHLSGLGMSRPYHRDIQVPLIHDLTCQKGLFIILQ